MASLFAGLTPDEPDNGDSAEVALGTAFFSDVDGTIDSVLYYKANDGWSDHTGNPVYVSIWVGDRDAETLVTSGIRDQLSTDPNGFVAITLDEPVAVVANTRYVCVMVTPTVGHYATTSEFFTDQWDAPPLHAYQDTVVGDATFNGMFNYTTTACPNASFQRTNYFVDVDFTPSGGGPSSGSAAGGITWVGAASGTAPEVPAHSGSAAGVVDWSGSAAGHAPTVGEHHGSAAGVVAWAGSAAGSSSRHGRAAGSVEWSGAATGRTAHRGSAAGSVGWSGDAVGSSTHHGDAGGQVDWTGTAAGHAPSVGGKSGHAAGSVDWTGIASGSARHHGSAAGEIFWTGTGLGTARRAGSAAGVVEWVGTAVGHAPAVGGNSGHAAGRVAWSGHAVGSTRRHGSAAGLIRWTGAATGHSSAHTTPYVPGARVPYESGGVTPYER